MILWVIFPFVCLIFILNKGVIADSSEIQRTRCNTTNQTDCGPDRHCNVMVKACLCKEGYMPNDLSHSSCWKVPKLGEPCRVNGRELFCHSGEGVDTNCPQDGTVCVCKAGYEPDVANKEACKPVVRLVGAPCRSTGDCTAAFSVCNRGTCECIEGFIKDEKNSSLCSPKEYRCFANDKPLMENNAIRFCEFKTSKSKRNDTCPPEHFCNIWPNTFTLDGAQYGHCCPLRTVANLTCPVGLSHTNATCAHRPLNGDLPKLVDLQQFCWRKDGLECIGENLPSGGICCFTSCPLKEAFLNVQGRCYPVAFVGDYDHSCEINFQCKNVDFTECRNGTCQCIQGYAFDKVFSRCKLQGHSSEP